MTMTDLLPPASILRDIAHKAICKAACDLLRINKGSNRLPMFSKEEVQTRAGFPYFNARYWNDIVTAIEQFNWSQIRDSDGTPSVVWEVRVRPIQLLGLTSYAFRRPHYVIDYSNQNTVGDLKKIPTLLAVDPRDELHRLEESQWNDGARRLASRFIAQDFGKKQAGYGSVEIAGGRLAWYWLETTGKRIEHRKTKTIAVMGDLRLSGLSPIALPTPLIRASP